MGHDGLWAMGLGAALLLYGICRLAEAIGRRRRRCKLCALWGGGLFVLGVLFVCSPQPWGGVVLWIWGGVAVGALLFNEWLSPQ